jgi:hypothetical protein
MEGWSNISHLATKMYLDYTDVVMFACTPTDLIQCSHGSTTTKQKEATSNYEQAEQQGEAV